MNTFYHFGDSYGTTLPQSKHFCKIIAKKIGFEYVNLAHGGCSNEQILNNIIKHMCQFKDNDIVFINFSFLQRGCWYNNKRKSVESTNIFYDEINTKKILQSTNEIEKILTLLNYYINYTEDYSKKIFNIINSCIDYLIKKNINVFYIFADEFDWTDELINNGVSIKFPNGFSKWLMENGFHLNEDIHFTAGIQPMLADAILRKTNNMEPIMGSKYFIRIDDMNFDKMLKPDKLI